MKSAEEILKECKANSKYQFKTIDETALKAMREYAAQAITEQLEVAAKEAAIRVIKEIDYDTIGCPIIKVRGIDPESITSCTRIPLP